MEEELELFIIKIIKLIGRGDIGDWLAGCVL